VFITKVVKFYHPLGLASPLSLSRRMCIEKRAILNADGINLYLNISLSMETINGRESQPPALLFMHCENGAATATYTIKLSNRPVCLRLNCHAIPWWTKKSFSFSLDLIRGEISPFWSGGCLADFPCQNQWCPAARSASANTIHH
jgi:hypothetical protein